MKGLTSWMQQYVNIDTNLNLKFCTFILRSITNLFNFSFVRELLLKKSFFFCILYIVYILKILYKKTILSRDEVLTRNGWLYNSKRKSIKYFMFQQTFKRVYFSLVTRVGVAFLAYIVRNHVRYSFISKCGPNRTLGKIRYCWKSYEYS